VIADIDVTTGGIVGVLIVVVLILVIIWFVRHL